MPATLERTLVFLKPPSVRDGHVGEIIGRFERAGLRLEALRMLTLARTHAETHYAEHRGKPFFEQLIAHVTSGPIVAFVVSGAGAVDLARELCGATDPARATIGTIRRDFGTSVCCNVVHASDSTDAAEREIRRLFGIGRREAGELTFELDEATVPASHETEGA
jgi:nucleoside-diphosphate kinase